ncbi:MAG TPA: glycosyltransferase [bacterium]|nr:glycosyltransferase [bacterium]HQO35193.1 glycosyltransferase [bacterium]
MATGCSIWSYSDISDRGFGLFKRRVFTALEEFGWSTRLSLVELLSPGAQDKLRDDLLADSSDFLLLINQTSNHFYRQYLKLDPREDRHHHTKIVWFLDDPRFYVNQEFEPDEVVCVFDDTYLDAVKRFKPLRLLHFPLAADLSELGKPDEKYTCEVAFVGGLQDQAYRREQLPEEMRRYTERLVESKLIEPTKSFDDLTEEIPYAPGKRIQLDPAVRNFLYWEANNRRRLRLLEQLIQFDLRIYGNEDWLSLTEHSPLRERFHGRIDPVKELPSLFASARININIHSVQCHGSLNQRDFNGPVAGGFLLSDWVPGAGRYFQPEKEAVYYSGIEDLRAKVRYYLDRPAKREEITRAGRERVLRDHTYRQRAHQLLETLGLM